MKYQDAQVTVMGLGRFGGGLGVTKWFLEQGAKVLVTDVSNETVVYEQLKQVASHKNLSVVCGEHRLKDFEESDLVIANPAIPTPWENPFLLNAWDCGIKVTTEIELVISQLDRKQVIGITGTLGKSTTAAMIACALRAAGIRTHLGGNIGGSLLNTISSIAAHDFVILELSSAMLWWIEKNGGWSPSTAVLTNIEPNHIDWHGSFEEYEKCKRTIFKYQEESDIALTQDPEATFDGLTVLGAHNQLNAAVAFLVAVANGADAVHARKGVKEFCGLPHRLQFVCDGFYNDSKSSTPTATKLAVDSFENPSKVHLIVGGYDKQIDLTVLADQSRRVSCLYTIGATGSAITSLAKGKVIECGTLEQAVEQSKLNMNEKEVLLFSPGCASWDQFDNYEQRGDVFCTLVSSIPKRQQVH